MKNLSSKLILHLTKVTKINPNSCQLALVSKIQEFISDFSKPKLFTLKKHAKNGLYIHGSVGVGKSVIIKALKRIYPQSEILHFNDLIFKLQSRNQKNLSYLKNIKRKKLILIDEFFINNLTSFILFRKFVEEIKFYNTKIIMNGNKSLETVYNDLVNPKLCEKIKKAIPSFVFMEAIFSSPENFTNPPNGIIAICQLVPFLSLKDIILGPKPILKTETFILLKRATIKCPNSCTKITTPKAHTIAIN